MLTGVKKQITVVDVVGEAAYDILSRKSSCKVLASVSQAVYLICEQDELLWLATSTIPLHRRGLQVNVPLPHLEVGTRCEIKDGTLVTESGDVIEFAGSSIWKTPQTPVEDAVSYSILSCLLLDTYLHFIEWPKPACLANLIPSISQLLSKQSNYSYVERSPDGLEPYWSSIKGIIQGCFAFDFDLLVENAARLVGLGPGLTPSGDDFLGGFLFALQLLCCTYSNLSKFHDWNFSDFILENKPRTNMISYQLLKDHAAGYAMEPLHSFANSLLLGQPIEKSLQFASKLVTVGHSTGWDLITGFLVGMSVIYA
jgi:hypothetical protein